VRVTAVITATYGTTVAVQVDSSYVVIYRGQWRMADGTIICEWINQCASPVEAAAYHGASSWLRNFDLDTHVELWLTVGRESTSSRRVLETTVRHVLSGLLQEKRVSWTQPDLHAPQLITPDDVSPDERERVAALLRRSFGGADDITYDSVASEIIALLSSCGDGSCGDQIDPDYDVDYDDELDEKDPA